MEARRLPLPEVPRVALGAALAAALLAPASIASAAQPVTTRSSISLSGVGAIGLGIKVSSAEKRTGQDIEYQHGAISPGCGGGTLIPRRLGVTVLGTNFRIVSIDVFRRGIATPSGIEVGDSVTALKRTYGSRLVAVPQFYNPADLQYEYRDANRKLIFFTDDREVTLIRAGRKPEVDYVEGCA